MWNICRFERCKVGKVKPIPRSDQHILTLNIPCKYISILHILDIISLPTWRWWVPLVVPITAKVAVLGPTTADVAVVGPSNADVVVVGPTTGVPFLIKNISTNF